MPTCTFSASMMNFGKDVGKYSWGRKSLNYTIALIGVVIILKEYMRK
jgi:hypothetical protein